jgi:hypothetical protein
VFESLLSLRSIAASFRWSRYAGAVVSVLLFSYTGVTTAALTWLRCMPVGDRNVLFAQPIVDCDSDEYKAYRVLAISVLCGFSVGFPLVALMQIRLSRAHQQAPSATTAAAVAERSVNASLNSPLELQLESSHYCSSGGSGAGEANLRKDASHGGHASSTHATNAVAAEEPFPVHDGKKPAAFVSAGSGRALSSGYPDPLFRNSSSSSSSSSYIQLAHGDDEDDDASFSSSSHFYAPRSQRPLSAPAGTIVHARPAPSLLSECVDPLLSLFRASSWYWQPQILLRRGLFVLVSVLLAQQVNLRIMLLQLLCVAGVLLQMWLHPFVAAAANHVALWSEVLLLLVSVLLGGWIDSQQTALPPGLQIATCLLVVPTACALLLAVIAVKYKAFKDNAAKQQATRGDGT